MQRLAHHGGPTLCRLPFGCHTRLSLRSAQRPEGLPWGKASEPWAVGRVYQAADRSYEEAAWRTQQKGSRRGRGDRGDQGCGRAGLGTEWRQKLETVGKGSSPQSGAMEGRRGAGSGLLGAGVSEAWLEGPLAEEFPGSIAEGRWPDAWSSQIRPTWRQRAHPREGREGGEQAPGVPWGRDSGKAR